MRQTSIIKKKEVCGYQDCLSSVDIFRGKRTGTACAEVPIQEGAKSVVVAYPSVTDVRAVDKAGRKRAIFKGKAGGIFGNRGVNNGEKNHLS